MAKYEVLTGEDAEKARLAGKELEIWDCRKDVWRQRVYPEEECGELCLYRIKPKPPAKKRVPLSDLRVLAGSMLVYPDGTYVGIKEIQPDGQALACCDEFTVDAKYLADSSYHYSRGGNAWPCWTEEDSQ